VKRYLPVELASLALLLLLAGCSLPPGTPIAEGAQAPLPSLTSLLPRADAVAGWAPASEAEVFGLENLYELVNGQSEAFFAYGFEEVVAQDYQVGDDYTLYVQVWQLATPEDAFGLYSASRSGTEVAVGNEGDSDPGRRLDFWQDRYLVRLFAPQALPDSDMVAFAQAIAEALPKGGEPPALLDRLPAEGLSQRDTIFFHEEISIQDHLWLGGQNLLNLGIDTDGLLARYSLGDGVAMLLVIQYGDAEAAATARDALSASEVTDLVLVDGRDSILAAVFGQVDQTLAGDLLADTLDGN
jgi:hypothetical protein